MDKDASLVPEFVSIALGRFDDESGTVDELALMVLFKDLRKKCIWVELAENVLDNIKRAINKDLQEGNMGKEYTRSVAEIEGKSHSISP